MALDLSQIRGVLLDMDGVLWRGDEPILGAAEFIAFLSARGIPFALATNNSSRVTAEYVERCAAFNITVTAEQVVSSASVTADELSRSYPPGTPIYVVGGASLSALLTDRGFVIDPIGARVVVVGLDRAVTYEKLTFALRCLLNGAEFIGTNGDLTFPAADGLTPGAGSLIALLAAASGKSARLMGKPEPAMFRSALERLGCAAAEMLMIGDRLDTDIAGAQNAGLRTALVLTGVATRADLALPDAVQPDGVYEDLQVLQGEWGLR